jgi:hypothetical protein
MHSHNKEDMCLQRTSFCDVVDQQSPHCPPVVRAGDSPVAFLPRLRSKQDTSVSGLHSRHPTHNAQCWPPRLRPTHTYLGSTPISAPRYPAHIPCPKFAP